jgi:hypothetical protein
MLQTVQSLNRLHKRINFDILYSVRFFLCSLEYKGVHIEILHVRRIHYWLSQEFCFVFF